ncbi:hypothetical protein Pcinc_020953 [Petrolisthes cinctipes]|uniref:Reverse transcriptase domain-containing protein n=1 Tax=Petrolisthes cinctipes TaxID=88211 RepID=A0AAE1FI51_PETCI|nr:hypothetical protein Pcinc_020953 [Petrolisthes cinctipes]
MPGGRANSSEVIAERGLIIGMWKAGASVLNIALKVGKITRTFKRSVGAEARQCLLPSNTRYHEKNINHLRILIDNVENLAKQKKITVEPPFKTEIISEASKTRGNYNSQILKRSHVEAAKHLRADPDITVRIADKSASFVFMDTKEYYEKMDLILSDTSNFKKITRYPTEALKKKLNKLINTTNALNGGTKLPKLTGDYGLGYCYGNVKTHKPGNKLRSIISQIPTSTYNIVKKLTEILTPYVPTAYSVRSPTDLLVFFAKNNSKGTVASFDVESLFTNVPVDRTIQYIINRVNHDDTTPNCDIPERVMLQGTPPMGLQGHHNNSQMLPVIQESQAILRAHKRPSSVRSVSSPSPATRGVLRPPTQANVGLSTITVGKRNSSRVAVPRPLPPLPLTD